MEEDPAKLYDLIKIRLYLLQAKNQWKSEIVPFDAEKFGLDRVWFWKGFLMIRYGPMPEDVPRYGPEPKLSPSWIKLFRLDDLKQSFQIPAEMFIPIPQD